MKLLCFYRMQLAAASHHVIVHAMPVDASVMSFSASSVQTAATMALVDGIAGMMFLVTPCVSWYVTPCSNSRGLKLSGQAWHQCKI